MILSPNVPTPLAPLPHIAISHGEGGANPDLWGTNETAL